MNVNSYICRYMAAHPDWREGLTAKGIQMKECDHLVILNYGISCDFTDPVVQESRGIIIDTEAMDVACWPFRKFGNYGESYADSIDWSTARVQEKIDGSIVKLWHNLEHWQWSTNSMIDAAEAHVMDGSCSFMDLIRRAEGYKDITFDSLDKDRTYIFELVAPEQKIVIRYEYPKLYHIGTRSNTTGEESNEDMLTWHRGRLDGWQLSGQLAVSWIWAGWPTIMMRCPGMTAMCLMGLWNRRSCGIL